MTIKEHILILFEQTGDLSIKEIVDKLMVSKPAVHYAMNQLLDEGKVQRIGRTPKTIYRRIPKDERIEPPSYNISQADNAFLRNEFIHISEMGNIMEGIEAFSYWCAQRKLPVEKTCSEFIKTKKKYEPFYENGFIDGSQKLHNTQGFDKIWVDQMLYKDFYAIERFGKTKLGTLLHYAKQGQSKMLMKRIIDEIKTPFQELAHRLKADAVLFVPPTIRREVQIMRFIETYLEINLPKISIQKVSGLIPVPQKSLNKMDERIRNAENTFSVNETVTYSHVLIIDDAVGSGATINQIAGKVKRKDIARKITGLAIVGSFKGFDVITDV